MVARAPSNEDALRRGGTPQREAVRRTGPRWTDRGHVDVHGRALPSPPASWFLRWVRSGGTIDPGRTVSRGSTSYEEALQRARLSEREAVRRTPSQRRLGRLEADAPRRLPGVSGGLAADPQAGPGRGATVPVLRFAGQRRRPHPADRPGRNA